MEYGKWTEADLSTVSVLAWDGSSLAPDPVEARILFERKLRSQMEDVLNELPEIGLIRVNHAKTVVELLVVGGDNRMALSVCDRLIDIISNASLTIPNARPEQELTGLSGEARAKLAAVDRLQALAAAYSIRAEVYGKTGEDQRTQADRAKAEHLRAEAATQLEDIYHQHADAQPR